MASIESVPAFVARAKEIGMSTALIDLLKDANIATFGALAFVCPANPNKGGEETQFIDAVAAKLKKAVPDDQMIPIRRLWYEPHAFTMSDLRSRVERTGADIPRQMPLAERLARLEKQKTDLKGLAITSSLEPGHGVIDKIQAMIEANVLKYLPPEKCYSREQLRDPEGQKRTGDQFRQFGEHQDFQARCGAGM